MARLNKKEIAALKKVRAMLTMESARFGRICPDPEDPLPKTEGEVDAFIQKRTRIWKGSWIFPVLDELIARAEDRKVAPGDRVIDLEDA